LLKRDFVFFFLLTSVHFSIKLTNY